MSELEYKELKLEDADYGDTYTYPLVPELYQEVGLVIVSAAGAGFYDVGWWDSKDNSWYQWNKHSLRRQKIESEVTCWFRLVPWDEI